jgi:hypothetical protein
MTILPNIDRRQLLISAPTVALAGIAPNIKHGKKFRKFADAHRKRLYNKMLARARRRCGDPNWAPTGMLSGGGLWLNIQAERQARKLYRRIAVADVG